MAKKQLEDYELEQMYEQQLLSYSAEELVEMMGGVEKLLYFYKELDMVAYQVGLSEFKTNYEQERKAQLSRSKHKRSYRKNAL